MFLEPLNFPNLDLFSGFVSHQVHHEHAVVPLAQPEPGQLLPAPVVLRDFKFGHARVEGAQVVQIVEGGSQES